MKTSAPIPGGASARMRNMKSLMIFDGGSIQESRQWFSGSSTNRTRGFGTPRDALILKTITT